MRGHSGAHGQAMIRKVTRASHAPDPGPVVTNSWARRGPRVLRLRAWAPRLGAALLALALPVLGMAQTLAPPPPPPPPPGAGPRLGEVLGGGADGFERARTAREFEFPADHGPHPAFRTEWWYVTGNLASAAGQQFGFQVTFFRFALAPPAGPVPRAGASAWRTRQSYMAHLAVTDVAARRFISAERFARGALGLAGARAEPLAVWLEDWSLRAVQGAGLPWRVQALAEEGGVDLRLDAGKPLVLQGDAGLSRKSATPGNASYYYSFTRLPASGRVHTPRGSFEVSGEAWLDREWSSSALDAGQVGWDWFALQLRDGRDLMFYQLRRADGSADPHSAGVLVDPAGVASRLRAEQVQLSVLTHWSSPHSGARYPAGWRLRVPAHDLDLRIEPLLADQEHRGLFSYWEGAVRVRAGDAEAGHGYVEMTGY